MYRITSSANEDKYTFQTDKVIYEIFKIPFSALIKGS